MTSDVGAKRSSAGFFSSAKSFHLPMGSHLDAGGVIGYPVDLRVKATDPAWPPPWLPDRRGVLWVDVAQWGLACFEHYLATDKQRWLDGARACATYLAREQRHDGGLAHLVPYKHSWPLRAPWLSGMAQGQASSLFVRLHRATDDGMWADAALAALRPLRVPVAHGGVRAELDGWPVPEEYPTQPPSLILNGTVFALWGLRDVAVGLDDQDARSDWEQGLAMLAATLHRWDTGWWSIYSLYPHPIVNPASSFYHSLHIVQLKATELLGGGEEIRDVRRRFESYTTSPRCVRRAAMQKAAFRVLVPRNRFLAFRLPWTRMREP